MIRFTKPNGEALLLAPSAIAQVADAGASQRWHGAAANIKTFDGHWLEVREDLDTVGRLIAQAQAGGA